MTEEIPFWWHLTRASGIVAWCLLSASVLWGLLQTMKPFGSWPRPVWTADLHRWLGGLSVTFTALHLGALVADSYVHFDLLDFVVPLRAEWRPVALVWAVVSLWALIAVQVTSLLRQRLSRSVWRRVHLLAYLSWWSASIHAATVGTDASHPAWQFGSLVVITAITGLLVSRIIAAGPGGRSGRARPHVRAGVSTQPLDTSEKVATPHADV